MAELPGRDRSAAYACQKESDRQCANTLGSSSALSVCVYRNRHHDDRGISSREWSTQGRSCSDAGCLDSRRLACCDLVVSLVCEGRPLVTRYRQGIFVEYRDLNLEHSYQYRQVGQCLRTGFSLGILMQRYTRLLRFIHRALRPYPLYIPSQHLPKVLHL